MMWTMRLEDLGRGDLAFAGGKGASLGELTRAGLAVPPGFVVGAAAYREHLAAAHLTDRIWERLRGLSGDDLAGAEAAAAEIKAWIEGAEIPEMVATEVTTAYAALGGRGIGTEREAGVAVRSSATAEDLPEASFAGQQETFLDVRGQGAVLDAVRRCWASLFGARALSYRVRMGFDHSSVALAVVVQAMVPADVAGVLFTTNPLTGAADEFVVTASYGLGEAVVSGVVTPDVFVVDTEGAVRSRTLGAKERKIVSAGGETRVDPVAQEDRTRYCLGDDDLRALAALGARASHHYGAPQDVEWALAAGRFYLLQSRPVTTVGGAGSGVTPASRWERAAAKLVLEDLTEHCPDMPRPFDFAIVELAVDGAFALLADLGVRFLPAASFTRELPSGGMVFRPRPPRVSPAALWRLPLRLARALREDPGEAWAATGRKFRQEVDAACAPTIESLEPAAVVDVMEGVLRVCRHYLALRFRRIFPAGPLHEALVRWWVRRAVGRADAAVHTRALYLALSYSTEQMNRDVKDLAAVALAHGRASREFQAAFDDFLKRWGNRPVRGVVALPSVPNWREEPAAVVGLVEALVTDAGALDAGALDARQRHDFAAAREAVTGALGPRGRRWFEASLHRARGYVVAREDGFAAFEKAIAHLRRTALVLGARLASAGTLAVPDDIFFVRPAELGPLVRGELAGVRGRIARRRRAYAEVVVATARGESWVTASGSLPPAVDLRAAGTRAERLNGLPASPGRVAGPVCIVRGSAEFAKVRRGDVLVAPLTAPAWTPLFALAAAVVTETGGPLSHAAIVAREYGIPAVLAVKGATIVLAEGARVVVDGSAGYVEREA